MQLNQPATFTDPELLEAVAGLLKSKGVEHAFVDVKQSYNIETDKTQVRITISYDR